MKFLGLILSLFLLSCGNQTEEFLPKKWHKDFAITISVSGGIKDESTVVNYTYDSCIFIKKEGKIEIKNAFALSKASRAGILQTLHELNIQKLNAVVGPTNITGDKQIISICFRNRKDFCFENGKETEQESLSIFSQSYEFLVDVAKRN